MSDDHALYRNPKSPWDVVSSSTTRSGSPSSTHPSSRPGMCIERFSTILPPCMIQMTSFLEKLVTTKLVVGRHSPLVRVVDLGVGRAERGRDDIQVAVLLHHVSIFSGRHALTQEMRMSASEVSTNSDTFWETQEGESALRLSVPLHRINIVHSPANLNLQAQVLRKRCDGRVRALVSLVLGVARGREDEPKVVVRVLAEELSVSRVHLWWYIPCEDTARAPCPSR